MQTLIEWWEIRQMQLSDAVFCPSVFLAKTLDRFEAIQAAVIPSALKFPETEFDESVFREKLAGKRYLLFFGTLSRLKGVDVLGEALPSVLRVHPDLHVVFVGRDDGMGRGQGTCKEFLHLRLKEFARRLCMLDRLPRHQLLPIIEHAAFVVLPSRVDNLPNTCLEAQSLGRIVIGTRDSSIDELVEEGSTGFLAENGSITSLQAAIFRALAMNTTEKHEMEVRTRAIASQRSGVHSTEELVAYYENVVRDWKQ